MLIRIAISFSLFLLIAQCTIAQYMGGSEDGYTTLKLNSTSNIYGGGSGDGSVLNILQSSTTIYSGGSQDGHAFDLKLTNFIWTGLVGDGWNITGNWENGIIPNINSQVIIPLNASNYPKINAGLMSIGSNPNQGDFLCKRITIQQGAELTMRVNAFLENYGIIEVKGTMYVLNSAIDAVQNMNGGLITIAGSGSLLIE